MQSVQHDDSFCRTVLHLIILNCLHHLKDRDAYHDLQTILSAEVSVLICIKDIYDDNENSQEQKQTWALSYDANKSDTDATLLVVEVKHLQVRLLWGCCSYWCILTAVYEARQKQSNRSGFLRCCLTATIRNFHFCFFNEEKRKKLFWVTVFYLSYQSIDDDHLYWYDANQCDQILLTYYTSNTKQFHHF